MRQYLSEGYKLNHNGTEYTILTIMGEGSSCVAYSAIIETTQSKCVIKEYYPQALALNRAEDGNILCPSSAKEKYEAGKTLFYAAISSQTKLRNTDETGNQTFFVLDKFESNNTYYVVMPMFIGRTYRDNKGLSLYDRVRVCKSVADYAWRCHKAGYLCLDIKPDNIFVVPETPEFAMFFDYDSFCDAESLTFGKTSSYTQNWAAPEQILPGSYSSITYATDVYALGELLFWSIFDRHSHEDEHRRKSVFLFNESVFNNELNDASQKILAVIFHNSLRSSVNNRYSTMDDFIRELERLLKVIYPNKERIISSIPVLSSHFIGRENEIKRIKDCIEEKRIVVLSGVGGIGKSAIARYYAWKYRETYDNIVYLKYSFDIVTTIKDAEFISDFEQKNGETDKHYCDRKINKLIELITGNSLIVIDNINIELEEADHKEIWKKLLSLTCDYLITSRCNQEQFSHSQINISEMDIRELNSLFDYYCPYEEEQKEYVDRIITAVSGHTLAIELIAKQAKSGKKRPKEMFEMLKNQGILGLGNEIVKWDLNKGTVSDHIRGMFSLSNISESQEIILFLMSLMPMTGVSEETFSTFYDVDVHSDIRYLIDNGWISETYSDKDLLTLHPVISDIVFEKMLKDNKTASEVYAFAESSMASTYIESALGMDEHYCLCRAIALRTLNSEARVERCADYLTRYTNLFSLFCNNEEREAMLLKAISIYDCVYEKCEYAAVRELAYFQYAVLKETEIDTDNILKICREHLELAKRNRDLFFIALWNILIATIIQANNGKQLKNKSYLPYYYKAIFLTNRISRELSKKNHGQLSEDKLREKNYGYLLTWRRNFIFQVNMFVAGLVEDMSQKDAFYVNASWWRITLCKEAKLLHQAYSDIEDVRPHLLMDEAYLNIFSKRYNDAIAKAQEIIDYYDEKKNTFNAFIYLSRNLIGDIALNTGLYERAISEYMLSLEVAGRLNHKTSYDTRVNLARAYLLNGQIEKSKEINEKLYQDLLDIEKDKQETYLAEVYYNAGYRYQMLGDNNSAKSYYEYALEEYKSRNVRGARKDVGKARVSFQYGKLIFDDDPCKAAIYIRYARSLLGMRLGYEHTETVECTELYDKCRPYLK